MAMLTTLRAPSGEVVALGHGALIGRLWSADLHVNDPRVSEAHAMVSLRGRDVRLLALRGRFLVGGQWVADVVLTPGAVVSLAEGVQLEVVDVRAPDAVLALSADGLARQVLLGVTSLYGGPHPRLVAGWDPGADDHVWPDGDGWVRGAVARIPLAEGDAWNVGGSAFRAVLVRADGAISTLADPAYTAPLQIVARWDTVHFVRAGEPVVVITGHMARAISQLATARAPLAWQDLAGLRWSEGDRDVLRHRWDMQVQRLRRKLATNGVRTDLLRADGSGLVELVLGPEDTVVDET